jgi:transcriptional regulator with XRE-family HTH domain
MPVKRRQDPRQPNPVDVDLGRLVRLQRMARGLSQTELANRIGVTFQQVQKYESGANRISIGRLVRIGRVLGVEVTYLLAGSGQAVPGRASDPKEQARLADGLRMLGRIGALRLLRAFAALPTKPPSLREGIVEMVEKTAAASGKQVVRQKKRGRRLG